MFFLWFLKNKIILLSIIHMFVAPYTLCFSHQYFFIEFLHYDYETFGYKNDYFKFFTIISWNISQKQLHQHFFQIGLESFFFF